MPLEPAPSLRVLVRGCAIWIAVIRGQLRPSDLAGLVKANEVAVLLADAAPAHAAAVVRRLQRQLPTVAEVGRLAPTSVGIASRSADQPVAGSILRAARDDASRRACV